MANPRSKNDETRYPLRRIVICVGVVAIFSALTGISVRAYKSVFRSFEIFSAVWLTHDMVMAHRSQTNGRWPKGWKDLEPEFGSINSGGYGVPSLDWVQDRVTIDFDYDPSSLDSPGSEQHNAVRVLKMADGTDNAEIRNANERIRSFLLKRHSAQPRSEHPM